MSVIEANVIGGCIHHPGVIAKTQLRLEHFSDTYHVTAFGALMALLRNGHTPDPISVTERMGRYGDMGRMLTYWRETKPVHQDTVINWVGGLKADYRRRELRTILESGLKALETETPDAVAGTVLDRIGGLDAEVVNYDHAMKPLLAEMIDEVERRFQSDNTMRGLPSGLVDLDEVLCGFQPGFLYVLGARPKMGKTILMLDWAMHAAIKSQAHIGIVSAEMSALDLAFRSVSSLGRIDAAHVQSGKLEDDEWPRMTSAINILAETNLRIFDKPSCSVTDIALQARAWKLSGGLDMLLVDYLSLLKPEGKHDTRTREVGAMVQALKRLARQMNIPLVLLAQLNRGLEQRPNKRPIMADLRDSGEIEQEADVIMFLYRDEVYNKETSEKGIAEINIAGNRHGPTCTVKATFLGQYFRFENFISEYPYE